MSDSEGNKELSGIARSVDALFENGPTADDPEAGLEAPPDPPDVEGEPLTGAADEPEMSADEPIEPEMSVHEPAEPPSTPEPAPEEEVSGLPDLDASVEDPSQDEESWPELVPLDAPTDEAAPAADGPAPPAGAPPSDADDDTPQPTALDLAVDAYLDGDAGKADEIESLASEMLEARQIDPVARSVGRLAIAAGEPPDPSILELARSIATPVVYEWLAGQIGAEHEETRLQEYFLACRNLGDPMAAALRDHLAESTDRHARRVHCDALVEMGDAGRRTVEAMVEDENRFLARNAVAILGETGGDRAVELVTMALANPAALVRREALRSLAKLGDEESGELVVGLLDDSDEDVRIQAAVTAGELHVERALRPILKLLDDASDPDEIVPLVRALGHLGDPGAVPSIEPRAVTKLFSKPPTRVRIAAYRALHQIGTPHARELVEEAVDDKNPEVRAAVRGMLD